MLKDEILLNNDLIKCQQRYFTTGGKTKIFIDELSQDEIITTTDNKKYILKNEYAIVIYDKIEKCNFVLKFKCNVLNNDHTYSRVTGLVKNGKSYKAQRYFYKYIQLVNEITYTLGLQYKGKLFN